MDMLRRSGGSVRPGADTTRSPTAICPADGSMKPAMSRSVVVFPQPEGPSRLTRRPCSTRSDTSSTTATEPYRLVSERSSTDATSTRGAIVRSRRSGPREHRLALFHEGRAALDVVLAVEALLHQLGGARQVALALLLHHFADDVLDRADGERRVARNRVGIILHVALEFRLGHDPVDQAHGAGFLGVELARGKEHLLGEGRPHKIGQPLEPGVPVAHSELGRRYREARIAGADPQVAADSQPDAAADTIAADHRDGRLGEFVETGIGPVDRRVVMRDRLLGRALVAEARNVGAGYEGLAARAGYHHHAHLVVARKILEDASGRGPHVQGDRVVTLGIVEDQVAHASFPA